MANTEQGKGPNVPSRAASLQRMLEIERKQKVSFMRPLRHHQRPIFGKDFLCFKPQLSDLPYPLRWRECNKTLTRLAQAAAAIHLLPAQNRICLPAAEILLCRPRTTKESPPCQTTICRPLQSIHYPRHRTDSRSRLDRDRGPSGR